MNGQAERFAGDAAKVVGCLAPIFARVLFVHLKEHQLAALLLQVRRLRTKQLIILEPFNFGLWLALDRALHCVRLVRLDCGALRLVDQLGPKMLVCSVRFGSVGRRFSPVVMNVVVLGVERQDNGIRVSLV